MLSGLNERSGRKAGGENRVKSLMTGRGEAGASVCNLSDAGGKEMVMKPRGSFRVALWGLGAALWAAPAMAQYEPVLTLEGSCPGMLRAEVSGAPPRDGVWLLFASETGSFRIPFWQYCEGVELGLGRRNIRAVDARNADEFGFAVFEGIASQRACGGFLQALTFPGAGCLTSNVVEID